MSDKLIIEQSEFELIVQSTIKILKRGVYRDHAQHFQRHVDRIDPELLAGYVALEFARQRKEGAK